MNDIFQKNLIECPIIAILRGITPEEITTVCDILNEAGIKLLEITLNSPDAFKSIKIAAKHCTGRQIVGAGTVLQAGEVQAVADSGGKFIISPGVSREVIITTKRLNLISIPGFMTPSEAFQAMDAGADYLKLFPAGQFGVNYIKDLKPVIQKPIIAVGGVNTSNLPDFLKECCGAGIGSSLYKAGKPLSQIEVDARNLCKIFR